MMTVSGPSGRMEGTNVSSGVVLALIFVVPLLVAVAWLDLCASSVRTSSLVTGMENPAWAAEAAALALEAYSMATLARAWFSEHAAKILSAGILPLLALLALAGDYLLYHRGFLISWPVYIVAWATILAAPFVGLAAAWATPSGRASR